MPLEKLVLQIGFGEYLAQIKGGIQMSPSEIIRLQQFNLSQDGINAFNSDPVETLIAFGNSDHARKKLVHYLTLNTNLPNYCESGLDLENETIRDAFFRFSREKIIPNAV